MESDALKTWLRKKAFRDAAASVFLALLAAMAGVVVLVVTFLFSYAVVWFGFNLGVSGVSQLLFDRPLHIGHPLILLVCSVFLVLLFIGNARTRREYLGTLLKSDCPRFVPQTGVFGALGFLLANAAVSSTMVADLLFSGPRLMGAAGGALGKAGRLMFLDVGGCSQVLATLLSRDSHCSFHELSQLSGVSDPIAVFRQMRDIGGIVFLDAGQTGLSLTRELRGELLAVTGNVALGPGASENPAPGDTICELLGVPPNTTLEEIEAAYEKWIWRSRHERRRWQGRDWQGQTERQIRAVNAAYEAFLRAHEPKETEESGSRIDTVWQKFKRTE